MARRCAGELQSTRGCPPPGGTMLRKQGLVPWLVLVCVLFVATAAVAAAPAFVMRGEVAAPSAPPIAPPRLLMDWWDVGCWIIADSAPWCPAPVKDPPFPKPKEVPNCDVYGPCQDTNQATAAR